MGASHGGGDCEITERLWHGSPTKIVDENLVPASSPNFDGEKVLYASGRREFAMTYAGEKWGDFVMHQGTATGGRRFHLIELAPGFFKILFDRGGYLYSLEKRPEFHQWKPLEWVSREESEICDTEWIPNILDALRESPFVAMIGREEFVKKFGEGAVKRWQSRPFAPTAEEKAWLIEVERRAGLPE